MGVERRVAEAYSLRNFFQEQWLQLSILLGLDADELAESPINAEVLGDAIDVMVDGTDARIRGIRRYKYRLRRGTRHLLEHIDGLVDSLPEALELSRHSFVHEPQVSAFFKSADHIVRCCQQSHDVDDYIMEHRNHAGEGFFVLLFMQYREKDVLGSEFRGELLLRDVRQTSVEFSAHRFMAPSPSESEARRALKSILFESVVECLKARLIRLRQKGGDDNGRSEEPVPNLHNPAEYLDTLISLLEMPLDLIRLEQDRICINHMGIKVSEGNDVRARSIDLQQVTFGDSHSKLLMLTRIPWVLVTP
jgi:hypothetical protein